MRRLAKRMAYFLFISGLPLLLISVGCGRKEQPLRDFPVFQTMDLMGTKTTDAIFRQWTVTAIVLWVPNTEPSDSLLPALEEIAIGLPEGAGILTIIAGRHGLANDEELAAARILAESTPHLRHLIANEDFTPLLSRTKSVPMTYFITADSKLVSLPIPGGNAALIRRELLRLRQNNYAREKAGERLQQNLLR